ncbi:uncharacterized protein [Henckelia pumila]|uniref:uncharacterized protein n=1 Tax=Henckelia pumila TaxID=405737 RepID=UPI003C6DEBDC
MDKNFVELKNMVSNLDSKIERVMQVLDISSSSKRRSNEPTTVFARSKRKKTHKYEPVTPFFNQGVVLGQEAPLTSPLTSLEISFKHDDANLITVDDDAAMNDQALPKEITPSLAVQKYARRSKKSQFFRSPFVQLPETPSLTALGYTGPYTGSFEPVQCVSIKKDVAIMSPYFSQDIGFAYRNARDDFRDSIGRTVVVNVKDGINTIFDCNHGCYTDAEMTSYIDLVEYVVQHLLHYCKVKIPDIWTVERPKDFTQNMSSSDCGAWMLKTFEVELSQQSPYGLNDNIVNSYRKYLATYV